MLNHIEGAKSVTDAVYSQLEFWPEKRAALMAWEADLLRILGRTKTQGSKLQER